MKIFPVIPTQNFQFSATQRGQFSQLTFTVSALAMAFFSALFFAVSVRGQSTGWNEAHRIRVRDVCTDTPIGVATGPELTLAASHVLGSHYLARGADGKYLQTWMDDYFGISYRLVDTGFNTSGVVTPPNTAGFEAQTAAIGWQGGGYNLFTDSIVYQFTYDDLNVESIPVSSTGTAGALNTYRFDSAVADSMPILSMSSVPSGEAAVCTSDGIISSFGRPWLHVFTSSGARTTYQIDSSAAYSTLISCSALSNSNIVYFWKNSATVYGVVVTKTGAAVVAKKTVLSLTASALASTVLPNQKVVLAWADSSTSKVAFQIMDATLSNPSTVIAADACSTGVQSDPRLMSFWDGFVLVLTSNDSSGRGVYGYRFGPDGTSVGGRFPLNSSTPGDQTNPVLAPLGSSGVYTGWSSNATTLVSRPFDLNRPPATTGSILPQSVFAGNPFNVSLTGYIQDPDINTGFDNITYSLVNAPSWLLLNTGTLIASGTPGGPDIGTRTVNFKGVDLYGKFATLPFQLTVLNNPPVVNGVIPNQSLNVGTLLNYTFPSTLFTDPDAGQTLTYTALRSTGAALPGWLVFTSTSRTFLGTPASGSQGMFLTNVTASDGIATNSTTFSITVLNRPPIVGVSIPGQYTPLGKVFNFTVPQTAFSDPDGDPIQYAANLIGGAILPQWLAFNAPSRTFIGTPLLSDDGTYNVEVIGNDPFGGAANQSFAITTTNKAPIIAVQLGNLTIAINSYFYFPLNQVFQDPEGFGVNVSVTGMPSWLTLASQVLSGTPNSIGSSLLNVTGTDPFGASNSTTFAIDVTTGGSGNQPPQVNLPIPSVTKNGGSSFTFSIPSNAFVDPDNDTLTYYATLANGGPLPVWLAFDQQQGTFTGNPSNSDAGGYTLLVRAIDPSGASAVQTFGLTIISTINLPPYVANPITTVTAFVGQLFEQYVGNIFADPNIGDHITLSASFSPNVSWITFDPKKSTLRGTPGHGDVNPVSAILLAKDRGGLSQTSTVVVNVQGDNWVVFMFKIFGPISSFFGACATVYKYRVWLLEKYRSLKGRATHFIAPPLLPLNSQTEFSLNSLNSGMTEVIPFGFPYTKTIEIASNPLFKGADSYEVNGETRVVDGKMMTSLPSWITYVIDEKKGVITIKARPKDTDKGQHKVNVVAMKGGEPTTYKLILYVEEPDQLDAKRLSLAPQAHV